VFVAAVLNALPNMGVLASSISKMTGESTYDAALLELDKVLRFAASVGRFVSDQNISRMKQCLQDFFFQVVKTFIRLFFCWTLFAID